MLLKSNLEHSHILNIRTANFKSRREIYIELLDFQDKGNSGELGTSENEDTRSMFIPHSNETGQFAKPIYMQF